MKQRAIVGIVMGSKSDLAIMAEAAEFLESLGIPFEVTIISAHRTPKRAIEYASAASMRGLKVIIAGAGGAAHLPGVIAALTVVPVIGVPIKSGNSIDGLDSILSMIQMPSGVPVATVALNGAKNAGILAAEIIGTSDPVIAKKLSTFKDQLRKSVEQNAHDVEARGYKTFLPKK